MKKQEYNPVLRKTEQGKKLYGVWKRIRKSPHTEDWDHFPAFYDWAVHNGYVMGAWLRLGDNSGSYCPENCFWYYPGEDDDEHVPDGWADSWNKTVNRIRKYYGMPPLEGTEYGD